MNPDDATTAPGTQPDRWQTTLAQPQELAPPGFRSLVPAVHRGSTVLFDRQEEARDSWRQWEGGYSYGLFGTPTALELAARIGALEGARQTLIVPGGQAALSLVYLAMCSQGCHVLVPYSAYGPNQDMADRLMTRLGVSVERYDPMAGAGIADLIRPETSLIWTESPGSVTFEVQDVPAICAAAHAHGVPVALDNTYAAGVHFDAFGHGVDISVQALTKYIGGHSDVLLGSVSSVDDGIGERLGDTLSLVGMGVSPDECSLALRGLQTLGVRLRHLEESTLEVARWLARQPEVERVLHPAIEGSPGHDVWRRDFTGSSSVFSIVLTPECGAREAAALVNGLRLFRIGWSWGGCTSLAVAYPGFRRAGIDFGDRLVRLNIGLEDVEDLRRDLRQALDRMRPA